MCGCSFTTCGCARRPAGADPSLAWDENICWLGEHEPCDERDDKVYSACSSGLCGSSSYTSSSSTSSSSGSSVSSSSSSGSASNLAVNGNMESGVEHWVAVGEAEISQSNNSAHQDTYSLLVRGSDNPASGVSQTLSGFSSHRIYEISAAVRLVEPGSAGEPAAIAIDADGKKLAVNNVSAEYWGNLHGLFKPKRGQSDHTFQFYGLQPNAGFYLDSVSVVARRRATEIEAIATGQANFVSKGCVNCHGNDPTDIEAAVPLDPFNLNKTTRSQLSQYIYFNMPPDRSEQCVSECAISIAAYILSLEKLE